MRISFRRPEDKPSVTDWHWRFAWLPVRVSAETLVWLERYHCKLVHHDGSEFYHWYYRARKSDTVWIGPMIRTKIRFWMLP